MPDLRSRRFFLWIVLAVVGCDLGSKLWVYSAMTLGHSIPLLGDTLRLTYVHNPGAAFSLFRASRWFFILVSTLSIIVVLSLALGSRYGAKLMQAAFGLILGGALGNLIDRIWLGVVIDFLDMGIGTHRWPVYNVADAGVVIGVILLGFSLLCPSACPAVGEEREEPEPRDASIG